MLENQKQVLRCLVAHCPAQFLGGKWVMDSVHVRVPRGAHTEAHAFKVCVLGVWHDEVVWPMLWVFAPESAHETTVGKHVFAAAEEVLGEGFIRHLVVDRGYLDGEWITQLYQKGTRVTIGVKEDMLVFEEMKNWRLPLPEHELAVYVGPHFALLLPSELMQIVLNHIDACKANHDRLLMALRYCESGS